MTTLRPCVFASLRWQVLGCWTTAKNSLTKSEHDVKISETVPATFYSVQRTKCDKLPLTLYPFSRPPKYQRLQIGTNEFLHISP